MSESLQAAVADVLAYLTAITEDGALPRDAQDRLRAVRARHPDAELELVWEREPYDGSLHYDVLVRRDLAATVSISVCRDRALPWPLRGVQRWSDANLLQVNGRMLTMEDAVQFLDVLWNQAPIMQQMVDTCLIREELEQRPVDITDDELQVAMDGLRRAHRLYCADTTEQWLHDRGLTHAQLERQLAGNLACVKLRKRIAEGRVAGYFEAHRVELETVLVARVECTEEAGAQALVRRAAGAAAALLDAAQHNALDTGAPAHCELATLRRRDATDELGAAAIAATPGDVVGPIRVGPRYGVAGVLARRDACPDEPTRELIEQLLFEEWLAERRQAASITWHWGRAPEPS